MAKTKKNADMFSIVVGDLYDKGEPRPTFIRTVGSTGGFVEQTVLLIPALREVYYAYELCSGGRVREKQEGTIAVDWQPMNFGGARPYLWCPRCKGRRVTELFLNEGDLVCRVCARIAYASQSEQRYKGDMRRAAAIRRRLGGDPRPRQPFGRKPAGMHTRTYELLCEEALDHEGRGLRDIALLIRSGGLPRTRERSPDDLEPVLIADVNELLRERLERALARLGHESE